MYKQIKYLSEPNSDISETDRVSSPLANLFGPGLGVDLALIIPEGPGNNGMAMGAA